MTASPKPSLSPKAGAWFAAGDFDGFFVMFFASFPTLLLIFGLCPLCGFDESSALGRLLPGVALSIFAGSISLTYMARRLSIRTGRTDVTAIPFGINTGSVFAYVFLIMSPVYQRTHDARLAMHMGVFACFVSGIIQTFGAFCAGWIQKHTPRAALLAPLAGGSLAFLCLAFVFKVFQYPTLAFLPSFVVLALFLGRIQLPWRIPGTVVCILVGVVVAYGLRIIHHSPLPPPPPLTPPSFHPPLPVDAFSFLFLSEGWKYLSVIIPISLADLLVCLQIVEGVQVAGDDYPTQPALLVNGLSTLLAAFFGSPFPTSLYLGHVANKAMGARAGYSLLNGLVTAVICLTGIIGVAARFLPLEVVAMLVVWYGLTTIGQAFTEVTKDHAAAVSFGLLPILAIWGLQLIELGVRKSGSSLYVVAPTVGDELPIYGLIAVSQGAILTSMVWTAALAHLTDRKFLSAALWLVVAAVLSCVGLIHGFKITLGGVETKLGWWSAPRFTLSYMAGALVFLACCLFQRRSASNQPHECR